MGQPNTATRLERSTVGPTRGSSFLPSVGNGFVNLKQFLSNFRGYLAVRDQQTNLRLKWIAGRGRIENLDSLDQSIEPQSKRRIGNIVNFCQFLERTGG